MGKVKKQIKSKKKKQNNTSFIASIVLLILMVLSIVGFAFMMNPNQIGTDQSTLQNEIPLNQFQDPQTGITFWGAVRNGEEFIFLNITNFDTRDEIINLATQIKTKESIQLLIDQSFNSKESEYLLNKAFKGIQLDTSINTNKECSQNTLVLTTNSTNYKNCPLVFSPNITKEYIDTEILVYYLIQ